MPFKQKGWVEAGVKQEIADNISHQHFGGHTTQQFFPGWFTFQPSSGFPLLCCCVNPIPVLGI